MAGWRVLSSLGANKSRPTLLIKYDFQATEYTVYVTDLIHIWKESLDRKSVIKRALYEDTSIDPTEGSDQLKLLLYHIQSALEGKASSSRKLQPGDSGGDLALQLTVTLPAPLQPLIWSISLKQQSRDVVFQQLFLPSFERLFQMQMQVQSLLSHMKAKDNIISRLVDKLESSGLELCSVFPSANTDRGSKSAKREHVLNIVTGLRAFDEQAWRQSSGINGCTSSDDLFRSVFADLDESRMATDWRSPDHWWENLDSNGEELTGEEAPASASVSPPEAHRDSVTTDDNDFQVQDISTLGRSGVNHTEVLVKDSQVGDTNMSPEDGSTTEEEGDMDNPPGPLGNTQPQPFPHARTVLAGSAKRIGMLGKKPARSKSPSPVPESVPKPEEAIDLQELSLPILPGTPRKKLGRIGGKQLPVKDSQEPRSESAPREGRLLGQTSRETEPPRRETSEERADRKRAELKRDLEEKRNAPAKKKRKF